MSVVRDRPVGVHRDDDADSGQHAHSGQGNEVEAFGRRVAKVERADDRSSDREDRPHR